MGIHLEQSMSDYEADYLAKLQADLDDVNDCKLKLEDMLTVGMFAVARYGSLMVVKHANYFGLGCSKEKEITTRNALAVKEFEAAKRWWNEQENVATARAYANRIRQLLQKLQGDKRQLQAEVTTLKHQLQQEKTNLQCVQQQLQNHIKRFVNSNHTCPYCGKSNF